MHTVPIELNFTNMLHELTMSTFIIPYLLLVLYRLAMQQCTPASLYSDTASVMGTATYTIINPTQLGTPSGKSSATDPKPCQEVTK